MTEERASRQQPVSEVLDRITDGFLAYDRDWRITHMNRSAEAYLKRPREQLIGRVVWDTFPSAIGTVGETLLKKAAASAGPVEFELLSPVMHRWVRFRAFPSPEGLTVYFRDITEEKQREETLRASEARYRALFENSLDGSS